MAARAGEFTPKQLVGAVWGFAKAGRPTGGRMWGAAATRLRAQGAALSPGGLAVALHSFATAGAASPSLVDTLGRLAGTKAAFLSAQDLANVAWAFAAGGAAPPPAALTAIAREAASRPAGALERRHRANLVWAYAKLGSPAPEMLAALASAVADDAPDASAGELAMVAAGYARAERDPARLVFDALAEEVRWEFMQWVACGCFSLRISVTFQRARGSQKSFPGLPPSRCRLITVSVLHSDTFPDKHSFFLSDNNTALTPSVFTGCMHARAWVACAPSTPRAEAHTAARPPQVRARGPSLPSRELATIMRAFATARRRPLRAFDVVAEQLGARADDAPPGALATLLWALAKSRFAPSPGVLAPVVETLEARAEEFPGRDLATALWAAAELLPAGDDGPGLEPLCRAVEGELEARRAAFNRMDMRMVCGAFGAAGYRLPVACKQYLDEEERRRRARKARSRGTGGRGRGGTASKPQRREYKQKGLSRG